MKAALVGFRGVGKTTIFSALTGLQVPTGYEQGASDQSGKSNKQNLGVIKVPDPRLAAMARIYNPKKITPAEIRFVDIPGRGAGSASALDAGVIASMRDVDAFALVVRGFENTAGEAPKPVAELNAFIDELVLADLAVVEKRLERLKKEKGPPQERDVLERCREALEAGKPLRRLGLRGDEIVHVAHFAFVSLKPLLVVLNVAEKDIGQPLPADFQKAAEAADVTALAISGQLEREIEELPEAERGAYLDELGIGEPARDRFIQASYALLDLISFLTGGEDEVRAWPIKKGTVAVKAAGKIHSDIERGFIRAEVWKFEDLIACGSEAKCREMGKARVEGKEYVVCDGDVVHFRFAV